mmetsp:Transcript_85806/g.156347  ORF Transcript_85806/g.156347 Transcript_85806/m.156347 type:complete len:919 (+) Transcript_85806:100-2856(+)
MAPKRTIESSQFRIADGGKFQGKFVCQKEPAYLSKRLEVWTRLYDEAKAELAKNVEKPIEIVLPDGTKKEGMAWKTTPMDIAMSISKGLANAVLVANVTYTETIASLSELKFDDMATSMSDDEEEEEEKKEDAQPAVLWDLTRPLEGSCRLELLKFDHPKGQETYWHSSAHLLGSALENIYGGYLCVGPPLESGFYYDIFVGDKKIVDSEYESIEKFVLDKAKKAEHFERLVMTKEQALELFQDNPFKVQFISTKVPDGTKTSAYRCGACIDLCRGPHVPSTDRVKTMMCTNNSSAYWLGKTEHDSLQRVYGITFPNSDQMKEYKKMRAEAAERDHRNVGTQQELFFFHATVSPGSCFWQPMGARLYNTLIAFIRREYIHRGFQEVISPNIYSEELFKRSGHYQNYKDNMYGFDVEGQEWFLKPMNCPGHCMIFDHRVRSYKELPLRMASFGVLHRNELSGTLSGLTRVRRFQQDDAHIFARPSQIKEEVIGALNFLYYVYEVFGFEFTIALSTRPKKAIGEKAVWDKAEQALKEALNESGREWSLNPGDGAFYGPKIDIRLTDAMRRRHQCGTIQLDFQLPIRFNLQYRTEGAEEEEEGAEEEEKPKKEDKKAKGKKGKEAKEEAKKEEKEEKKEEKKEDKPEDAPPAKKGEYVWKEQPVKAGFERPVIIHRAILGSVERMVAILTEHYGGKWPFWLSPRQVMVIPVAPTFNEYAQYINKTLTNFGFYSAVDLKGDSFKKKIRNAQMARWNYSAIVGANDEEGLAVSLRSRESEIGDLGSFSLPDLMARLNAENAPSSQEFGKFHAYKGRMPEGADAAPAPAPGAKAKSAPADAKAKAKPEAKAKPAAKAGKQAAAASPGNDLEAFLEDHPYLGGFAPSKKDLEAKDKLVEIPQTPNMARWYAHISSFTPLEQQSWS